MLYYTRKKDVDVDYSYIVFSYCKAVEMLSREKLVRYFIENRSSLPPADNREDYLNIGIKSYDVGGVIRYSFKNEFDISSSDYLVEINKHRLLRKKYTGNEHIMPWDKLKFINHCIKTGKDPIDGTKSAGMLLLFYCAYKNFLKVQYKDLTREDIIVLAGNLIRLQNERNNFMHSKILEQKDWLDEIRSLSIKCIETLSFIK
ncbi:hypothetical protein Q428_03630 [Fervidicella metallireducens AeB]|uniref:Uncharacterized protein n=1 Tax=Fervidicella metallireducens AeB TaxID=1403537 RepID=A0A017RWU2_9CLOT|nr:hypothetical protein [Fervidicella metallireducens]EYE89248.1 hypothetical protein Q428_03630 [Fervidicella metallireducens AeB]